MDLTVVASLKGKSFSVARRPYARGVRRGVGERATTQTRAWKMGERPAPLKHKTLAMIFEKQSLRTRSTFDIAMYQLGGHSVLLSQNYIGWGRARDD